MSPAPSPPLPHAAPTMSAYGSRVAPSHDPLPGAPPRVAARLRRWLVAATILALLVLKIAYVYALKVNSDEPQHLHVLWAWTIGRIPYRDIFDNHAPLFQMLWAPLLALLGERADIVELMRLSMLPLYAAALWLTGSIARTLWGRDVAASAVALTAVYPTYFTESTQFRPDALWAVAWLATVYVLIAGRLDARRGAAAGLAAGITVAISLKTIPLLVTGGFAALLLAIALHGGRVRLRALPWRFLAAFAVAALFVPAVLAAWFVANGAGAPMVYALFEHNVVADLGRWQHGDLRFVLVPLTLPIVLWLAWRTRAPDAMALWARRCFVLLAAAGYVASLYGYWPLFTRQDLLPAIPFAGIAVAVLLLRLRAAPLAQAPSQSRGHGSAATRRAPDRPSQSCDASSPPGGRSLDAASPPTVASRGKMPRTRHRAVAAVVAIELAILTFGYPLWEGHRGEFDAQLAKVLALTTRNDWVMDAKGESVFRHRPIYWVLEGITLTRMRDGTIVDDIPARLAATGTPVVWTERLPDADRAFVERNYLRIDDGIYVAGQNLGGVAAGEERRFAIAIPTDYTLTENGSAAAATIDGRPCSPRCTLAAGTHTLQAARAGEVSLVWARAVP